MSIESAAEYLDCSTKTIRRRIASGDLRAYRLASSRVIRVDLAEVDRMLRPIPTAAAPAVDKLAEQVSEAKAR
jgi:excisionase family DNA binding protein